MTRIEFFFNVEDKLKKVVELSEKAVMKQRRLMVFAPDQETVRVLGDMLWTQSPTSFLPHCSASDAVAEDACIIIDWQAENLPHHDLLINLQTSYPPFFSRFTRLIEIVGQEEQDKVAARKRYKFYRDRGYEMRSFDASGAAI
jgi:DNA polymerase III subunit chi